MNPGCLEPNPSFLSEEPGSRLLAADGGTTEILPPDVALPDPVLPDTGVADLVSPDEGTIAVLDASAADAPTWRAADDAPPVCPAGWADCNNDPVDGCEIPVGRPNSCSRQGLTEQSSLHAEATPGCGTPHCGPAQGKDIESFGTWHCRFCAHCQQFDDGGAWCLSELGTFSEERCIDCCDLDDKTYPQTCTEPPSP